MKFLPDIEEIKNVAASGKYNIIPVSCEILSDICTPIEAMQRLKNISSHCYMLESAAANEKWGRYTFLGFDPKLEITCKGEDMKIGDVRLKSDNPDEHIRQLMSEYKSPKFDYLPSFTGGLVGYFSYDYLGYSEPTVRNSAEDTENFKDVDLMLFDKVIAFDNVSQKIILIVNMPLNDIETNYNKAVYELKKLIELIRTGDKRIERGHLTGEIKPLFDKEQFCNMVEKAKHHIHEGDIFQIVLSNRLSAPFEGSLLNTYRVLRTLNPSPYMFYLSGTDVEVAGASPETLVKLENGILHTFPLAGTRPRGKTEAEDKALEAELLADEKELAEHNMLVDLGRNDLGKISQFGTVEVEKLRSIERYSHVMHMKSYFCQDKYGQIAPVYSISAGLDYPGIGPEHAHLHDIGRAEYVPVTDEEAVEAFEFLSKTEGIIPAIESAHAVAHAMKLAPTMDKDKIIVITVSGRGDKDCAAIARYRGEDIYE